MFFEVSYAHQGCIYLIKSTVKLLIIISNICFLLKYYLFVWYKSEFSTALLQSSVSRDPSEIFLKNVLLNY